MTDTDPIIILEDADYDSLEAAIFDRDDCSIGEVLRRRLPEILRKRLAGQRPKPGLRLAMFAIAGGRHCFINPDAVKALAPDGAMTAIYLNGDDDPFTVSEPIGQVLAKLTGTGDPKPGQSVTWNGKAVTAELLTNIEKERGYPPGWAESTWANLGKLAAIREARA